MRKIAYVTQRGLANIVGACVSITEFGAIGDGVTDCSDALQRALDTVPAGCNIFFPTGTWRLRRAGNFVANKSVGFILAARCTIQHDEHNRYLTFADPNTMDFTLIGQDQFTSAISRLIIGECRHLTVQQVRVNMPIFHGRGNTLISNLYVPDNAFPVQSPSSLLSNSSFTMLDCQNNGGISVSAGTITIRNSSMNGFTLSGSDITLDGCKVGGYGPGNTQQAVYLNLNGTFRVRDSTIRRTVSGSQTVIHFRTNGGPNGSFTVEFSNSQCDLVGQGGIQLQASAFIPLGAGHSPRVYLSNTKFTINSSGYPYPYVLWSPNSTSGYSTVDRLDVLSVRGVTANSGISLVGPNINTVVSYEGQTELDDLHLGALYIDGRTVTGANVTLSTEWGTGATVVVDAGSTVARGRVSVTAGTMPAANPTVTVAFPTQYKSQPRAVVIRADRTSPDVQPTWTVSTTQMVITFPALPVAGQTYSFEWITLG